jgi:hypothetical protein
MSSVLVALLLTACAGGPDAPPADPQSAASTEAWTPANPLLMKPIDEMVEESKSVGAIRRVDPDAHEVWVNPEAWALWDTSDRQTFTASLALYCDQRGKTHGRYVEIIDDRTGKPLARYGPGGFELIN